MEKEGISIAHIAKHLHHTYKTIQNYLNPDYSVTNGHYNVRIPNKLAPYESEVIELRSRGITYSKIHEIISKKGYDSSIASLRMFMQKERIRHEESQDFTTNSRYFSKEFIQRRSLSQLIYKHIDKVTTISKIQYEQVL